MKIFRVTAVDDTGAFTEGKKLWRAGLRSYPALPPRGCLVAMESCSSENHRRRFAARQGHVVTLTSPQFVVPYRKSTRNDVNDAGASFEAPSRPSERFVGLKSAPKHLQQVHHARNPGTVRPPSVRSVFLPMVTWVLPIIYSEYAPLIASSRLRAP